MEELRKKVRNLRVLVCFLLFLATFQSVFLYLISQGKIPSSLVVLKEVIVKEDDNTNSNAIEFNRPYNINENSSAQPRDDKVGQ